MVKEIKKAKDNLKHYLYQETFDKINVEKCVFQLLRECIKEREYEVQVGAYQFNLLPQDLSVTYETEGTVITFSNEDIYYETTRVVENRYFVISREEKDEYSIDTAVIKVSGIVTNVDGDCEENYQFELFTEKEDDLKNYITLNNVVNFHYAGLDMETPYSVIVSREVKRNTYRVDVFDFFKPNQVFPVIYDCIANKYVKEKQMRKIFKPNDYSILLPMNEEKKDIVYFLYLTMMDFYKQYMSNKM